MMHGQSTRKGHLECYRDSVYFGLVLLQEGHDALSMVIGPLFQAGV
jgi:hypothetical protein